MKYETYKVVFDFSSQNTKTLTVGGHYSFDKRVLSPIFKFGVKFQSVEVIMLFSADKYLKRRR